MGLVRKTTKQAAFELVSGISAAKQSGRRLLLKFLGPNKPELDRIEFWWTTPGYCFYWQVGASENEMSWSKVPQALAIIFSDYVISDSAHRPILFTDSNGGEFAGALGNEISESAKSIHRLFAERLLDGTILSRVRNIFGGKNFRGKDEGERRIFIEPDNLPPDCIEVYWPVYGQAQITDVEILRELNCKLRTSLGLAYSGRAVVENSGVKVPTQPNPAEPSQPSTPTPPVPPPQAPPQTLSLPESLLKSIQKIADHIGDAVAPVQKPQVEIPKTPQQKVPFATPDGQTGEFAFEIKPLMDPSKQPEDEIPNEPPPAKIAPQLFQIQNPYGLEWNDDDGLIDFGNGDSDVDIWRIRDACEGLLIFGAVGSGKTSGSGSAIARAYLQAGFGGLVLTAKPDEAKRWLRMCEETDRAGDFVHVTPHSGHQLNFLQYETQRPGDRIGITDDLISIFRCLIDVTSHTKGNSHGDEFWTKATNQLMRKLVDVLLLAGEPLTLNRMMRFINEAPDDEKTNWRNLKVFASVLDRARDHASMGTDEDKRIFREAFQYWTQTYPNVTPVTRSGFITNFSAMADTLSGRGIYEMIGTGTNLTPEMILSGKVVVLDIPLKGNIQGGLMVQAIWKLLFQQAVERRADKGLLTARPAFLWEDEGHEFFSEHDVRFQPTARDIRAPHVIISQNIHNFLHLGHSEHAVMSVFAAMNTYVFHTNGDLDTNRWASDRIGQIKKLKLTTDGLLKPLRPKDISFWSREPHEVENVGALSLQEETKRGLDPEDFSKLKRGGDGTCEAVILWLSHRFAANKNRNFCVLTFEQERRTT